MVSPERPRRPRKEQPSAPEVTEVKQETYPPYEYQDEAADKVVESIEANGRALLDMATGLGKTRVAIESVERLKPPRILMLADSKKLLSDHAKTFTAYLGGTHSIATYTGNKKKADAASILFATRQMMRGHKEKFAPDEFDFIIDDESHHAAAETYEPTLRYFTPKLGLLGMTATPDRTDWKDIREIFGPPVVSHTLEEGMRRGWLTPVDYRLITENVDQAALERLLIESPNVSIEELNREIFREKSLEENLEHLVAQVDERQTAVMCGSIEEAEKAAYILREMGYRAEGFHTKSDDDESLDRFRKGSTQFITAVNMMNEGIDVPELGAVAFLRPTDSKRIFLQQLGRVLRKYPGKEKALVLDYVGSVERLAQINEIMHDITSKPQESRDKEAFFDTTLIGGENAFTFDQKVVDKIGEILQKYERRYTSYDDAKAKVHELNLKNPMDYFKFKEKKKYGLPHNPERVFQGKFAGWRDFLGLPDVPEFTPEELPDRIHRYGILTPNQYAFYAAGVDEFSKKRLPSLEKLRETGQLESLGLRPLEEVEIEEKGTDFSSMVYEYTLNIMNLWPGGINARKALEYGYSEYRASKRERERAEEVLVGLSRGDIEPLMGHTQAKNPEEFKNVFGVAFAEAEEDAKKDLNKVIDALEDNGLLTKEFFTPDVLYGVCELVLYHVRGDYYGSEDNADKDGGPMRASKGPYKGMEPSEVIKALKMRGQ